MTGFAKQSRAAYDALDCSHGDGMCQDGWSAFCSIASQLFVPTVEFWRWRAQIKSRSARRAAAKRLGLDLIEHAIRLLWSGVSGTEFSFGQRSQVRPGSAIWVCLPDQ